MKTHHMTPRADQSRQGSWKEPKTLLRLPAPLRWSLPRILLVLGAVLCAGSTVAQSQTGWDPVDEVNVTDPSAIATGIAADSAGNLFVAGRRNNAAGTTDAVIRQSSNQGDSWSESNIIFGDVNSGAGYERIVSTGGMTVAAASKGRACLVRSRTEGVNEGNWSDLMEGFIHPDPKYLLNTIWDVELDAVTKDIYVVTEYSEEVRSTDRRGNVTYSYVARPFILRRVNGSWMEPVASTFLIKKVVTSGTDIYCSGDRWRVRKSNDKCLTWSVIDAFIDPQYSAWDATDIAIDSNGQLFVSGRVIETVVTTVRSKKVSTVSTNYEYWMTRKGIPPTPSTPFWTWTTDTDKFRMGTASSENSALAITIDKDNNVLVTGRVGPDPGGVNDQSIYTQWMTRQYSGGTWTTTDQFAVSGFSLWGNRIAAHPSGNVFATGGGTVYNGYPQWNVRRKLAPVPSTVP